MPFKKGETPEGAVVFKEGESGNPAGRPVGIKNRSTIARNVLEMTAIYPDKVFEQLQKQYPEINKSMSIEEMGTIIQADKMIRQKDSIAYRAILDSAYGAPKQETDTTVTLTNFSVKDVLKFEGTDPNICKNA